MKRDALRGIIQFILSLGIVIIFELFFFSILGRFGLHFKDNAYTIMNLVKYIIEFVIVGVVIYHGDIFAGKENFKRSLFSSIIISLVTFIVMVVFTIILQKVLKLFDITISNGFVNYFNESLTMNRALEIVISCFIKPCLICSIFVLGISNIIRKEVVAILTSGIGYAIFLILLNHLPIDKTLVFLLVDVINMFALTYLYKSTGNIYTCFITYIIYIMCGSLLISYVL